MRVSGLKINYGKSQWLEIYTTDDWELKMTHELNCKQGVMRFKYLGVPVWGNPREIALWQPLVQSSRKKLSGWKGWFLSFGGQIIPLNFVLSSLLVFLMMVYLLSKGVINILNKIRRGFLLGGSVERNKD